MNKEQHELVDDAYKNYQTEWMKENPPFAGPYTDPCLTQEEIINKCKTDTEFSEKWGLKIEERKLSLEERIRMYALKEGQTYEEFVTNWDTEEQWLDDLSDTTIPTKLITLTYNNETVESYD